MIAALVTALIVLSLLMLYFAWRSREFRKFLAGAFFVSGGIQFYLYLAKVSVPLLGTKLVLVPEISRLPLHYSFHCVRALPLLWLYQKVELRPGARASDVESSRRIRKLHGAHTL